ncbi:hypothetical protein OCV99_01980 [Dorea acetigenes]|jgi:hypothetical protein|uniref:DUF3168 domain-containing protein n=1 Tax=Dorea acetigenes TaxID=2981787 RepID=A0ABT2RIU3_9FIRM|nr:hypothetical protein [Dorea acetigenes]MCU6685332.1 hypothetical protein [Dorea acetigenes]SCI44029.1 Uncharacterised protein [uncultured Clostridium sp.]
MIEKLIADYLNSNLETSVYLETPETPPASYVLIEKTGSSEENYIYSATLAIQSYAESLICAAELNEKIKKLMHNAVKLNEICKSKLNSDYNYTDTATKRYRYQAVFDVTYY